LFQGEGKRGREDSVNEEGRDDTKIEEGLKEEIYSAKDTGRDSVQV
jgi:hypothetical protein